MELLNKRLEKRRRRAKRLKSFEELYKIKGDGVAELDIDKAKRDQKFRKSVQELKDFQRLIPSGPDSSTAMLQSDSNQGIDTESQ